MSNDVFQEDPWPEPVKRHNRYTPGITVYPRPKQLGVKHVLYLVAYDISHPSRLRRVANVCEEYGVRVEKSVFECDLTPDRFQELWGRLAEFVDEDEDALVAYQLCKACVERVESTDCKSVPRTDACRGSAL